MVFGKTNLFYAFFVKIIISLQNKEILSLGFIELMWYSSTYVKWSEGFCAIFVTKRFHKEIFVHVGHMTLQGLGAFN